MNSQPIPMDPKYIIDLIVKRRWTLLIPFCVAMILGIYFSITLPKIYEAETMILIQPQRVPQNYVQPIVTMDTTARLSTLSQQVLSRTNLEKLINEFNLFEDDQSRKMFMEDKLEALRGRITINVSRGRRGDGGDSFSIAFKGQNPETAMKVTNALASYFINENLKIREAQAVGTSDFLDNELKSMEKQLESKEKRLMEYKRQYLGGLPEQLASNVSILNNFREQKTEKQAIIRGIEQDIFLLKDTTNRFNSLNSRFIRDDLSTHIEQTGEGDGPLGLNELNETLISLQLRYKDKHPDVVRLKRRIQELEEKIEKESEAMDAEDSLSVVEPKPMQATDFRKIQIAELQSTLKEHQRELKEIDKRIEMYDKRIDDTPKREQELLSIQRDYDNMKESYESLLARKLESDIAVNMERRQKGEQFRILDSARVPVKPISPDMKKLFVVFLAGGVGIGAGIVFLMEFLNSSFKRPEDIEVELDLPVLCSVPRIINRKARILKRLEHVFCAAFGMVSLVLMAGFALLTLKGIDQTLGMARKIYSLWVSS